MSKSEDRLFERNRRKDQAKENWLDRNKEILYLYTDYISKMQQRKIFQYDLIFAVVGLGLLVNLGSSVIETLVSSIFINNLNQIIVESLKLIIILALTLLLGLIFNDYMKKYDPHPRSLFLPITLNDCIGYRDEETFNYIYEYLSSENFADFTDFPNRFFNTLQRWFGHLFSPITGEQLNQMIENMEETIKFDEMISGELFPTVTRKYNISDIFISDQEASLSIILRPHVIYSFGAEKQQHVRDVNVDIIVDMKNPMKPHTDEAVQELYYRKIGRIPEYISIAIEQSFYPLIDEINPAKIIEKLPKN